MLALDVASYWREAPSPFWYEHAIERLMPAQYVRVALPTPLALGAARAWVERYVTATGRECVLVRPAISTILFRRDHSPALIEYVPSVRQVGDRLVFAGTGEGLGKTRAR